MLPAHDERFVFYLKGGHISDSSIWEGEKDTSPTLKDQQQARTWELGARGSTVKGQELERWLSG